MGELCVGDDVSGARDSPVPVSEEDGAGQTSATTRGVVTSTRTNSVVCGGESGVVCFYPETTGQRNNGAGAREHFDRTIALAGTTNRIGVEIWASSARMI